jgi:hypothetical protein
MPNLIIGKQPVAQLVQSRSGIRCNGLAEARVFQKLFRNSASRTSLCLVLLQMVNLGFCDQQLVEVLT